MSELRFLIVDAIFREMLLAETAQLLVDEVLVTDAFLVANVAQLQVTLQARLAHVLYQAADPFSSARLLWPAVGSASAASDSAAALENFQGVAQAEI